MTLRLDEPFRWGGVVAPPSILTPHEGMATVAKAATGLERSFSGDKPMLFGRTPQKVMREAQALYYSHPWVRRAEKTVTSKVAGLPWHIEDQNDDEVDDETVDPRLKAVRDLIEKPQAALPPEDRQPGITTRRGLVSITSRHMGLCGVSYWYLDQMDQAGLPLALIYVNPARLWPRATKQGIVIGYSLDADDYGNGGTFFRVDQILPFYLEVPDWGSDAMGLVAAAALKARIVTASDLHALSVLGTGGRIAGLVAPKDGYIDDPEKFAQMERDFRNVNDAPDAAKRMTILRGAVEFTKTAADPDKLKLLDLGNMGRDDIFATWGVPPSQAGVPHASGLNAGALAAEEAEVLMTGPVHDRVVAISETVQFDLLDRYAATGIDPQLVIEEPSFDDDGPAYEIAARARELPLTNNDRRKLINLDPLPDYGPDGEPLGVAILLPSTITAWAQGPDEQGKEGNWFPGAPKPKPEPTVTVTPIPPQAQLGAGLPSPVPTAAKAGLGIREAVDQRVVPAVRKAVARFLTEQRADIVERIRNASARQLKDASYWFRDDAWDKALVKTLRPHMAGIVETVTVRARDVLAKADPFTDEVERFVLKQTGVRVKGINETTRDRIADVIRSGISESLTAQDIAARIEELPAFDEARAELVARTESAFAYNSAAISSYREYGVTQVQAIDGDDDERCADRNGRIFTIEEASGMEDHPNGTLDWAPA